VSPNRLVVSKGRSLCDRVLRHAFCCVGKRAEESKRSAGVSDSIRQMLYSEGRAKRVAHVLIKNEIMQKKNTISNA
jgi:hypothetical protein